MKKIVRIISLLVVLGLCLTLCGCSVLDSLKESRASITEDGVIELYDGSRYLPLPECKELSPSFTEFYSVYIVEDDLPLLLTVFSNIYLDMSDDKLFLLSYDSNTYYCRSDVYDSILDRINNGYEAKKYGYWFYDYESSEDIFYPLTQAQVDVIKQVCDTTEPEILPEAAMLDWSSLADLFACSDDMLFMQDVADVLIYNGKYYVVDYSDVTTLYSVPDELYSEFEKIMKKQVESDSYWEDLEDWEDWE